MEKREISQVKPVQYGKQELIELLEMPYDRFSDEVSAKAKEVHRQNNGDRLTAVAMFGYDNICKNQCLYCGMRASNSGVKRYRLPPESVREASRAAAEQGFQRIFFVSGEDPRYGFENLLTIIRDAKELGLHVSLACGEFTREEFRAIRDAGADQCVLKFEMSQPEVFNRLNPSTTFERRMQGIRFIKESGMDLASGNIVDYPGQTTEQIAEDILLMRDLEISWAPIIPYLPAQNTPLAKEGGRGDILLNLREISLIRLMLPNAHITAQQPGNDLRKGLADEEGNLLALNAGADMLFADLLPGDLSAEFSVIDNRVTLGLEHIRRMASLSSMHLVF